MLTLKELRKKAIKHQVDRLKKLKEAYRYARSLGFNPEEARILSSRSKEIIDKLAEELNKGKEI